MYCSIGLKEGVAVVKLLLPIMNEIKDNINNLEETASSLASQQDDIEAKLDSLDTKQGSLDIKQQELNTKVMSVSTTLSTLVSKQDDIEAKLYSVDTKQDQLNIRVMSVSSELKQNVSSEVKKTYDLLYKHAYNNIYTCGGEGGWRRVVYLNVADPSYYHLSCLAGTSSLSLPGERAAGLMMSLGGIVLQSFSLFLEETILECVELSEHISMTAGIQHLMQYNIRERDYTIDEAYVDGISSNTW